MAPKSSYSIETIRHSLAHILALAVLELYPKTKFGIGPTIANGFYYDFELPSKISDKDLEKIEKKMKEIIKKNLKFSKEILDIPKAIRLFQKLKQDYKIELLKELKKGKITTSSSEEDPAIKEFLDKNKVIVYKVGSFIDLCRGPHVESTRFLPLEGFKLTKIAGAYWRGDEKNPMLTRIYGVAFNTKKELEEHLRFLKETEERDHRKLMQELDLASINEEIGAGLVLWHPKGAFIRQLIEDYIIEEHLKENYKLVKTPHIANLKLWKTSGHWDFYRENMYAPMKMENEEYIVKPMNCPFHIKIYAFKQRSYKDFPLRFAELGTVYRYEKSGVLHGLLRVRGLTQDDAHIFVTADQLEKELTKVLRLAIKILKVFGFKEFQLFLSTRPEKYCGSIKDWEKAEKALKKALKKNNLNYKIDPGEGVFYGPKIDLKIKDALGRMWQCSTIQLDFNLPQKFNIHYIDIKGKKQRPFMVHRALLGSLERFMGILIEHYAGAFPLWLCPIQVVIIPVGSRHFNASRKLKKILEQENIRSEVDEKRETVAYKIRKAEKQKIPYMVVIGDKELSLKKLALRVRGKNKIEKITLKKFIERIKNKVKTKSLTL